MMIVDNYADDDIDRFIENMNNEHYNEGDSFLDFYLKQVFALHEKTNIKFVLKMHAKIYKITIVKFLKQIKLLDVLCKYFEIKKHYNSIITDSHALIEWTKIAFDDETALRSVQKYSQYIKTKLDTFENFVNQKNISMTKNEFVELCKDNMNGDSTDFVELTKYVLKFGSNECSKGLEDCNNTLCNDTLCNNALYNDALDKMYENTKTFCRKIMITMICNVSDFCTTIKSNKYVEIVNVISLCIKTCNVETSNKLSNIMNNYYSIGDYGFLKKKYSRVTDIEPVIKIMYMFGNDNEQIMLEKVMTKYTQNTMDDGMVSSSKCIIS